MTTEFLCHFDGTNGSTTLIDETGNYTLTANNGACLITSGQVFGSACLAVNNGYVPIADAIPFYTNDHTIRFRFTPTTDDLIDFKEIARFDYALVAISNGILKVYFTFLTAPFNVIKNLGALTANTSYALSIECFDGGIFCIYLNGERKTWDDYYAEPSNGNGFYLGNSFSSQSISGLIDELLIDIGLSFAQSDASYSIETQPYSVGEITITESINQLISIGEDVEIHLNIDEPIVLFQTYPPIFEEDEQLNLNIHVSDNYLSYLGHESVDIVQLSWQLSSAYSFEIYVAPNWINKLYLCRIGDLDLPITSISSTLSASGSSYVSLSIPSIGNETLSAILARTNEKIIISRKYIYADKSVTEREFIKLNYDTINSSQGAKNNSIVLVGRGYIAAQQSKQITAINNFYLNYQNGKRTLRLAVDDRINLGDEILFNGDSLIVGKITYYIESKQEFMECTEYLSDGIDTIGIGSNVRPIQWQKYLVNEQNSNYFLWKEQGYLYNGIANNPADYTNYSYYLWYDGNGLLWYAPNFVVYEEDGLTQASINI